MKRKCWRAACSWLFVLGAFPFLTGPQVRAAEGQPKQVTSVEGITEYQYDNGLRVLLFPDPSKPTVTVNVTYFVGSRHEGLGETGMAHLLEHMVFKGTPTYENIWGVLEDHGARFNGTTWVDRTNYFETLPASDENLEFALKMEADRMVNSFIRKSDLDTEMTVVRNEFEMGENDPSGILSERIVSSAYLWHNYGKSTIGSKEDIERVPIENLQAFYKKYYQPDNAMLVVAGQFEPQKTLNWITKYFGSIPRPTRQLQPTHTVEPVQDGERHVVLRRNGDVHAVGAVYHICAGAHDDYAAVQAAVNVLVYQPAGRLYKALVETGMATSVNGNGFGWAEPGVAEFGAEVRLDQNPEPVLAKMTEIIEGFPKNPVTEEEANRAKAHLIKNIELAMTRSDRIGIQLSEWAAMGDWRLFFIHRDRVEKLTKDELQRVALRYFVGSNRTSGIFYPTKEPVRADVPEPPNVVALVKDYKGKEDVAAGETFEATPENVQKRTKRYDLPGGIKLALLPKETRGDAVRGQMQFHFGTEAEFKGKTTAVGLVGSMLMRGTGKRSFQDIRDELDRLKARVNIGTGGGFGADSVGPLFVGLETTRENVIEVLKLIGEILRDPAFKPEEFEIVKKEMLTGLEQQLSDPQARAFVSLSRRLDPWSPDNVRYTPTVEESIERVKGLTLDQVKSAFKQFFGAGHAEIALVGDFDEADVKKTIEQTLGDWKSPGKYERIVEPYRSDVTASDEQIRTPDKKMAIVGAGLNVELRDDDPDYPAFYMGNYILGSSAKSRLLNRLRQKEGLSYGAGSMFNADDFDRRATMIGFGICATENAEKAFGVLLEEFTLWHKDGVTPEELDEAKNSYSLKMKNSFADDTFVARQLTRCLHNGRDMNYFVNLEKQIQALTPEKVKQAIAKYFDAGRLVKVKAGDLGNSTGEPPAKEAPSGSK
jgi:zinc protease